MTSSGRRRGPASYLKPGCHWLDEQVTFQVLGNSTEIWSPDVLQAACLQLWEISRDIRAARGRLRLKAVDVSDAAGVRRQTLADIEMGVVWPDAVTLGRICQVLGLRLQAVSASQGQA